MASREVFHFDEFTLEVQERRLLRGAEVVRLSPKAYDMLVALVQQRGRLVTKDELLKRLWPESFVEEGGLTVHVSALRKALGEDAHRPIYIETVARSGYRFIAAVACDLAHEKPLTPSAITRPVELYELVGRGRSHLLSGSYFELPAAVDAFRSAIEIDPTYAPAHAGLARARCVQAAFRVGAAPGSVYGGESVCLTRAGDGQRLGGRAGCPWHGPFSQRVGLDGGGAQPAPCARNQSGSHRGAPAVWVAPGSARAARRWAALQATGARARSAIARRSSADRHLVLASAEVRRDACLGSAGAGVDPKHVLAVANSLTTSI